MAAASPLLINVQIVSLIYGAQKHQETRTKVMKNIGTLSLHVKINTDNLIFIILLNIVVLLEFATDVHPYDNTA